MFFILSFPYKFHCLYSRFFHTIQFFTFHLSLFISKHQSINSYFFRFYVTLRIFFVLPSLTFLCFSSKNLLLRSFDSILKRIWDERINISEKVTVVESKPQTTYIERTVIPNYQEKTIYVPSYVEKTVRVPTVVEQKVRVPAAPTVIEKAVEVPPAEVNFETRYG